MSDICVSVIVPAYNAAATLEKTLLGLSQQHCFQPYEVIVVDDGSTDNTAEIVRLFEGPKKPFYVRQDNAGPASARNRGARLAKGEFLAFTDSDCVPHPDWISLLMSAFGRARVGAVAGSYGIANPESLLAQCVYGEILWRHRHLMPEFPNSFGSYNFCVKREIFEAVGGFNTAYRRASGEDNDLSYKIIQSGWRICFEPKALVDHYHPVSVSKYLKEQARHGFWRVRMYLDHPRMMRGDGYTFWKDMLEVPLCAAAALGLASAVFHYMSLSVFLRMALLPFFIFEAVWALVMLKSFFHAIFYTFVFILRAFARFFGFSTGIFTFFCKKMPKKIE